MPLMLGLAAVGLAIGVHFGFSDRSELAWRLAARRLGLQYRPAKLLESPSIGGTIGGFAVKVDMVSDSRSNRSDSAHTRVVIRTRGRVAKTVALASETFWSSLDFLGEGIEIGDRVFDDTVKVRGPEGTLRAVLNEAERKRVSDLVRKDRGFVRNGRVVSETGGRERDADILEARIRRMVTIARGLSIRAHEVPERIAQNVASESEPGVRLRCLRYLGTHIRESSACRRAARVALGDRNAAIRLVAAKFVDEEGISTLEDLVADERASDSIRAEALELLGERLSQPLLIPVLKAHLSGGRGLLVTVALRIAERERLRELAPSVVALARAGSPGVVAAATRVLGVVGDPSLTPLLARLLDHSETSVKIAACRTLGEIGTLEAVEPLLRHAEGLFKAGDLKRAARQAIEQIQLRAGDAEAGRLSVTGSPDEGALTLAIHADGGALSGPDGDET